MYRGSLQVLQEMTGYAYPIDSEYLPIIRVFEAPYTDGDCPIAEYLLTSDGYQWLLYSDDDRHVIAGIGLGAVSVTDTLEVPFVEGKSYEVRIYESTVPVSSQPVV